MKDSIGRNKVQAGPSVQLEIKTRGNFGRTEKFERENAEMLLMLKGGRTTQKKKVRK